MGNSWWDIESFSEWPWKEEVILSEDLQWVSLSDIWGKNIPGRGAGGKAADVCGTKRGAMLLERSEFVGWG